MKNVINYIDSIVTTVNPAMHAPIPEKHPCQKGSNEIDDRLQDYIKLINKLQQHTRCSPSYCKRTNREGVQTCRFGYPKEHIGVTFIREDKNGQPELCTARNNPYINPHNRIQLQGWRANMDLKPILSIHAALQYISKYASKAEPSSQAFSEIFEQILNNSNSDDSSLTSIQKLLFNSVSERDISAQETCHLLNGTALYHSSRSFVSLNINKKGLRWIQGTGSQDNVEDTGRTTQSALKRYWDQPEELEDFSLFELYLTYKLTRGQWKKCKKENIVHVWPHPSSYRNRDQWESYYRVKVLLHVRHQNMQELTENGNINWSTLYNQHIEMINDALQDLLRQPVDDEEVYDEESEDELPFKDEDEDEEQYRYDWMRLAEMGLKATIHSVSDLDSRDMDQNHEWTIDA
ncbi:hypothetical protein RclHR1_12970009 [Rhizophagus clarus]|uniref:Uncharacterized protein n=1 Tax=Rhizophagus clarus TaxID=94130 RepID=A0A2Z6R1H4_9GLOM|nr:hypothetical protein RclHR1_12970009 [Rhizophagus clarus]